MIRSLLALLALTLGLAVFAACGDDDDDGGNGNGNGDGNGAAEQAEGDATEVVSQEQICADGLAADTYINRSLQVLTRATSDASYEAIADPASESYIEPAQFRQSVEHAARVPGTEDVAEILGNIADLLEQNLASGQPFSDGSGGGETLLNLVNVNFVQLAVDYGAALEEAGCLQPPAKESPTPEES